MSDCCVCCGEEFTELGLLPDERLISVDGSECCSVDCCHEHDAEVWESDAYPIIPCEYLD